jgi:hypothetical protein
VTVSCPSEACTAIVAATIKVPKVGRVKAKTFKLKSVTIKLGEKVRRKFALRISQTARLAIMRALRARKSVSAVLSISARDAAGNTRRASRRVRFTR